MRTPLMAANWKMHKTVGEARETVRALWERIREVEGVEVVICAPFTCLFAVGEEVRGTRMRLGAQNMFWREEGAFTGEVSPLMLKDLGCEFVIVGHSERRGRFGVPDEEMRRPELRSIFGETDHTVNLKVKAAHKHGLIPIVCVGETIEERRAGRIDEVVRGQIERGLSGLSPDEMRRTVIAYEPVWAIGTGEVCDPPEADRVIGLIRGKVAEMYGEEVAREVRVLYGGSIKPENIGGFVEYEGIDGGLVGGASLKADSFAEIVRITAKAKRRD
ncbi:MAG TPA: triose-phosphate isomerase [Armatimonadetes bacterium]|nr:triose-phosphate isomerase [Armatimonadota bacterium]